MTIKELRILLISLGVPDFYYNISGRGMQDERTCLIKEGDKWNVFFSERGGRTNLAQYESESEACEDAFARIMRDFNYNH